MQTVPERKSYYNYPIISPFDIPWDDIDKVVIASRIFYDEMIRELRKQPKYDEIKICRYDSFLEMINDAPFKSCHVGDLDSIFIYRSEDYSIPTSMMLDDSTFASNSIDTFFALSEKYYGRGYEKGYFFDIGANIGTTSIYVKKKWPRLKVVAFELTWQNVDVLRCNTILNHTDIQVVDMGISNVEGEVKYHYVSFNSGGSGIDETGEKGYVITLDAFANREMINPKEIQFIWIDVEGYEMEAVLGSEGILRNNIIPLFHECSPTYFWGKNDILKTYSDLMRKVYDGFIDVNEYLTGITKVYPAEQLYAFVEEKANDSYWQTDLFFL